ncbi:ubiquitin fusion degradation protein, partial [Serendipita sp. 399]
MALATHSNAAQQLRPSTMMPLTSLTERSQSNSASLSNNNPPLVRVTLTDADMLANDPRVDSPSPPEQQPLPPNAGYKRILALISIHRKLWRTRINGRLCILEYRLPAWIRRRIDSRRSSKWDGYDMTAWIPQSRAPPRTYWDGLADADTHSGNPIMTLHMLISNMETALARLWERLSVANPERLPMPLTNTIAPIRLRCCPGVVIEKTLAMEEKLRNPANSAASTHAGVLEFIADEGCVYLPHWMMKTLKLSEGQPIRITGASLPKGKFVKLQAQETSFVEVSDPRAILEQALRNFTCLTQGDIIEICYNTIVFGFLVMETRTTSQNGPPSSRSATPSTVPGISVFETDLEVDFATPKGWKEPPRPTPKPVETMASRLGLDVGKSPSGKSTPAGSRPG